MNFEHTKAFLARVVPWNTAGWINLHYTIPNGKEPNGKPWWRGDPTKSPEDFVGKVARAALKGGGRDMYLCLSAQSQTLEKGKNGFKFLTAVRDQTFAIALQSLFLDVDVKAGAYATTKDAVAALAEFRKATGLPRPSAIVGSGSGGLHVYWVLDRALSRDEWQPLAHALAEATRRHGLHADTACTVDSARILRVPGTLNYKSDPPKPVSLMHIDSDNHRVEDIAALLEPYKVALPVRVTPSQLAPDVNDELLSGIERRVSVPLDITTLAGRCGFVDEALATGGAEFANPLWNMSTLLATFCDDGEAVAHKMAMGHPSYSHEETQALYERKLRERQEKNLGWPKCMSVQNAGCSHCSTCPLLSAGQSPLNFAQSKPVVHSPPAGSAGAPGPLPPVITGGANLPSDYLHDQNMFVQWKRVDQRGQLDMVPVMNMPITRAWLQVDPYVFNFYVVAGQPAREMLISIPYGSLQKPEFSALLGNQGLLVRRHQIPILQEFLVAWSEVLTKIKGASVQSVPFGWTKDADGTVNGFAYGGRIWRNGSDLPAASPDPNLAAAFTPRGKLEKWRTAAKMITDQKRPQMDAYLAAAFGGPLMRFTGQSGVVIASYSIDGGRGKSTAMAVGTALWGSPTQGRLMMTDTQNEVFAKMGGLVHIPMFWDEIKGDQGKKQFTQLVFQMSLGREKRRLKSDASHRKAGEWQTLMVSATNDSILEDVQNETKTTTAGLYRVFEFVVPGIKPGTEMDQGLLQRTVDDLRDHYGQAGLEYAKFLGANVEEVARKVAATQDAVIKGLKTTPEERFWVAAVVAMILGAHFGNKLGLVDIDEKALKLFLRDTLDKMRQVKVESHVDLSSPLAISSALQQYLKAMQARHTIKTDRIKVGAGKPRMGEVKILSDISRLDGINVHIAADQQLIRISKPQFKRWMVERDMSPQAVMQALKRNYVMREINAVLGGGTPFAGATEYLIELEAVGTNLEQLCQYVLEVSPAANSNTAAVA